MFSPCPACVAKAEEERQARALDEERRARLKARIYRLDASGVPSRYRTKPFTTYAASTKGQRHALRVSEMFAATIVEKANSGQSLLFVGKPGCGKTHLAVSILLEVIIRAERQAIYTTASDLVRAVRATYSRSAEESESEVMNRFSSVDLLVIDELGIGAATAHGQSIIFDIIDRRYRSGLPMVLISNLPRGELADVVGERVIDRLNEIAVTVPFDWKSHRTATH
jgi:DNA replication protein DnaC